MEQQEEKPTAALQNAVFYMDDENVQHYINHQFQLFETRCKPEFLKESITLLMYICEDNEPDWMEALGSEQFVYLFKFLDAIDTMQKREVEEV